MIMIYLNHHFLKIHYSILMSTVGDLHIINLFDITQPSGFDELLSSDFPVFLRNGYFSYMYYIGLFSTAIRSTKCPLDIANC